ncbi:WD40 repeat-containing protein [Heterostelium album PN500]|uniref:WD40 repeat-containing protein n=1 Tax=Heterostelium pallidum (strain ATCC 26659 / Pp 5 / PN500) TaxID=670386 RepID=D3BHT9_HETP5|nr:WD40 repeat-containing protein [Heterostelium album PN500]EFA78839.1 WD40 repeat-containing protein [Heterostelium album PN500]|eukprot:XP_020430963.1 WD40 repeat-containing protein [Heterostelium album PN500]
MKFNNSKVLLGHQGSVLVVRFNNDGQYCLSGSQDKTIKLWNPSKELLIHTFSGHGYPVLDVKSSPDNNHIYSCAERQLYQWDITSGETIRKFKGHSHTINSIALNRDQSILLSGSYDKSIKIWDLKSRNADPIQVIEDAQDSVTSVIVNDDEFEIISCSVDGAIRIYDIRNGKLKYDQLNHALSSIYLTHDKKCLLVGAMNSSIQLLEKKTGDLLNDFSGHRNSIYKLNSCTVFDDSLVVSGSEDNDIYLWDIVEGNIVGRLKAHQNVVTSIDTHPKQHIVISASTDASIRYWDTQQ